MYVQSSAKIEPAIINSQMGDEEYETLLSMGFPPDQCRKALKLSSGDLDSSINLLLSGTLTDDDMVPNRAGGEPFLIQIDTSQYTFAEGVSACSCIALNFASEFLININQATSPERILSAQFLTNTLFGGVEKYKRLPKTGSDHKSPEDVLKAQSTSFNVCYNHDILQGVLCSDDNPLSLKQTLIKCLERNEQHDWIAVILTKTPETICICMSKNQEMQKYNFILIDSHPRPQLGIHGCYALLHSSLNDLIVSLKKILPITSIDGMSSLMLEMYNSFDAYPLYKRSPDNE